MADDNLDRGDEFEPTGGTPDDTGDLKNDDAVDSTKDLGEAAKKELKLDEPEIKKEEPKIPKSRFDEGLAKARKEAEAATKRADDLEAQMKANQGVIDVEKIEERIDELEEELEKSRADGNAEKAAGIRRQIRALNRQVSDSAAAAHAARATAVAVEQIRYGALVDVMEQEHPELNPDKADTYDQEKVDELTEYKLAFEAAGLSSSDSLKKALKAVYPPGAKKEAAKVEEEDDDDETEEEKAEKADKAAKLASERKEAAVKKALEEKKKQPADNKKAGLDSDKAGQKTKDKPVSKMTEKEWDELPDEDKKRLRGDVL